MATSKKIELPPVEVLEAAAEKYRKDLEKWIYPGGKKPSEEEMMKIRKHLKEFPNDLSQEQKDKMFEAHQKLKSVIEIEDDDERSRRSEQISPDPKEWLHIHGLSLLYFAYRSIELYESGTSIEDIANEFGTYDANVISILKTFQRL